MSSLPPVPKLPALSKFVAVLDDHPQGALILLLLVVVLGVTVAACMYIARH